MRKIHIAQGVENLEEAIDFYSKIFYDIQPTIGNVELGTGRIVNGAEWRSKYVYLVVFEGHEKSSKCGLDHLGVIFSNREDLEHCVESFEDYNIKDTRTDNSVNSSYWIMDSSGKICWEFFLNVIPDEDQDESAEPPKC